MAGPAGGKIDEEAAAGGGGAEFAFTAAVGNVCQFFSGFVIGWHSPIAVERSGSFGVYVNEL
jgi:hypothetical protein